MRNWAGNVTFRTAGVRLVPDVATLQRVVREAERGSLRPVGTTHSFSEVADGLPGAVQIAIPGEYGLADIRVADDRTSVSVPSGVRYGDLAPVLERAGLALGNLASLPHISIGGSVSTGTHGSGIANRSLAAAVRGLELVDGTGDLVTLRRGDPDFAGAVVSLGALGYLTRLELDVEPSFALAQRVYRELPLDGVLEAFDEVTGLGYSVNLFTTWADPDVVDQLWLKRRIDRDPAAPDGVLGAMPAREKVHPVPGVDPAACTAQLDEPGAWLDRLPHFRLDHTPSAGVEIQSEYLVPRRSAIEALRHVRELAPAIAPHLLVCEIRRIARDELWLSGAFEADAVGIHFTWRRRPAALAGLLPRIEERLLPLGARPHWGKTFVADREALEPLYPRMGDFRALAARFDPRGVFASPFLARKLGV